MTPRCPRTLRRMLSMLETYLLSRHDADELWHILSALRGPDDGSFSGSGALKRITEAVRSAAFPRLAVESRRILTYPSFMMDLPPGHLLELHDRLRKEDTYDVRAWHCRDHLLKAVRALLNADKKVTRRRTRTKRTK